MPTGIQNVLWLFWKVATGHKVECRIECFMSIWITWWLCHVRKLSIIQKGKLDLQLKAIVLNCSHVFWKLFIQFCSYRVMTYLPSGIYLLKVSNINTRIRCEICSKFRHQNDANSVVLVSLLLTLNTFHTLF